MEKGRDIDIDYRIVLPGGEERWIHSRGRMEQGSPTNPVRLLGASVDVTERKRAEKQHIDRFNFETLLADLSTRVLSAPADEIDAAIGCAQRQICEFLDIDLSALWQWAEDDPKTYKMSHFYRPDDGPLLPDGTDARDHFSWSLDQMLAGRVVALSSIDDAPPEAAATKKSWEHFGVKSALILPLGVDRVSRQGGFDRIWVIDAACLPDCRYMIDIYIQNTHFNCLD